MIPLKGRNLSITFNNQGFSLLAIQHVDTYMVFLIVTLPNSIFHKTLAVLISNLKFLDFIFSYLPDKTVLSNSLNWSIFLKNTIFPYKDCLIQIQFFEKSFIKTENDQIIPLLILHFEYLETWTDDSITLSPASPYWPFFTNLCDTLDVTNPIPLI